MNTVQNIVSKKIDHWQSINLKMEDEKSTNLAIFEMREELVNAVRFVKSRNKVALKAALHACYADAKRFFGNDKVSIKDFSSKLQLIYNRYKQEDLDAAVHECERLTAQIEMLISSLGEQGRLPESAIPLLAEVMSEGMKTVLDDGVADFDTAAAELCNACFREMPESREDLWQGIFTIVVTVFQGEFGDGRPAIDYIRSKQSINEESQTEVQVAIALSKSLLNQKILKVLTQLAAKENTLKIVQFALRIATSCERLIGSPTETTPLPKGYVASIAWLAILTSLVCLHLRPELCMEMINEGVKHD